MATKEQGQVVGVSNPKTFLNVAVILSREDSLTPAEQDFIEAREALTKACIEQIALPLPVIFGYQKETHKNRTSTKEQNTCQLLAIRQHQLPQTVQQTAQQQTVLALDQ